MREGRSPRVAIVDYGMGNLFSVKHACQHTGIDATITSSPDAVCQADAVIVPGVGAFGKAMETLTRLGMVEALHETVRSGKLLVGICLGMQLLMEESSEFGRHSGLGLIPGDVVRFPHQTQDGTTLKVPQVCWNRVWRAKIAEEPAGRPWDGTLMDGLADGEFMYFVHSYYVRPSRPEVVVATTEYGGVQFCSALTRDNVIAWQFHPERSGARGLAMYRNLSSAINRSMGVSIHA